MSEQKKTVRKPSVRRRKKVAPTHEQIAIRAYYLHLEAGGGGELDHWLRAERELATA